MKSISEAQQIVVPFQFLVIPIAFTPESQLLLVLQLGKANSNPY